jgi:hypothetical protein
MATSSPDTHRNASLQRVSGKSGKTICVSSILPMVVNSQVKFIQALSDSGDDVKYRPFIKFFDKNLAPITASTSWTSAPLLSTVIANKLTSGAGSSLPDDANFAVIKASAAAAGAMFVQAGIIASNMQLDKALARRLQVNYIVKQNTSKALSQGVRRIDNQVVESVPVSGFAALGTTLIKDDSSERYHNLFSLDTISTSNLSTLGTSLTISVPTGVTVGDTVGVNMDDRDTHWTTVASISGSNLTLAVGVTATAATGSRVVFNRWTTETI